MDQESSASSKPSPAPAGLNKASPYSKHVAGLVREGSVAKRVSQLEAKPSPKPVADLVREGSVAERVSQLQAKLSSPKTGPGAHLTELRNLNRPVTEVPLRHSISKSLLSSSNLSPLPETPIRRSNVTKSTLPEDSVDNRSLVRKLAGVFDDHQQQHDRTSRKTGEVDATKSTVRSVHDAGYILNRQSGLNTLPALLKSGDSSTSSPQSSKSVISSRLIRDQKQSLESLNQLPRFASEDARFKSPQNRLRSSPEPSKGTMSPSSGSAYSRILPFTSNPSIPSYIPKRQSQNFGTGETPSPRKLKSMIFTEEHRDENKSQTAPPPAAPPFPKPPPIFQSPRYQNDRYLRRRTFNTKSDESLRRDGTIRTSGTMTTQNSTSTLEDVFVSPKQASKTYHGEPQAMTGDNDVVPPKNPHDIHNLDYTPSVMPRRFDYRQMLRNRHTRPTAVVPSQTHTLDNALDGSPKPRTGVPLDKKDVASRHVSDSTDRTDEAKGIDIDSLPNISSVISSGDWNNMQPLFSTNDEGKTSAEKPQQSDEVDTTHSEATCGLDNTVAFVDGTRSRVETEDNDSDSVYDAIKGLFAPNSTPESQVPQASLLSKGSPHSVHKDQVL